MTNKNAKPKIYVRKARSSDRKAVFKFCKKTWSWGDYIPEVWDKWLKDKNGRAFVATINGVPVGISHISIDKPHEVWLRGARTDPNYRRMGVATAITKKCLKYAKQKGAKTARLSTESDNIPAQAVVQKLGFKLTAEFVEMKTENITKENSKNSKWAKETEISDAWRYLKTSENYHKAAGLYTIIFQWFSLEKQDLKQFIKQHHAILHTNAKAKIDGLTLIDNTTARQWHENTMQTCYIDGNYNTTIDMIKLLKNHCHDLGIKKIYAFTCNKKPTIKALEKLGFEPPDSIDLVYEKKIFQRET